ncbi:MAG TPA: SGNH/GDSL hydrolase family protein [Pseudonocardiaceae bacterium]|nr:SGNH/GDSL hydrolase family protein [Pseudonocardiaceae bacterium]
MNRRVLLPTIAGTTAAAMLLATVLVANDHSSAGWESLRTAGAAPAAPARLADTWAASAADLGGPYTDKTVRDIVHTSIAGSEVRVRLSNAFGTVPVTFDSVYLGKEAGGAALVAGSNREVTFGGSPSVTVPKGAEVLSDPVPVSVAAQTNEAVSLHVAGATGEVTGHPDAQQTNYYSDGDTAADPAATSYVYQISSWFFVDGLVVNTPSPAGEIVTLGDSITDGYQSTANANHRWPDYLAARLLREPLPRQAGVANEGISGNEILADGAGVSAQARLDRDVLSQPGAKTVVFLEGINDIGNGVATSAQQLIAADEQIIARAHADGVRIFGGTLVPFVGAGYSSPQKETIREALNAWIRTSGAFDGVVDFDKAIRDPSNPTVMLPAYDSGDHLHPNDAGYQAMANAVDLNALVGR